MVEMYIKCPECATVIEAKYLTFSSWVSGDGNSIYRCPSCLKEVASNTFSADDKNFYPKKTVRRTSL